MKTIFKYERDRRSKRATWIVSILLFLLCIGLVILWGAEFISAWFIGFMICLILLVVLSIPRYISLDEDYLEIHCIVDMTRFHVEDIELIRRIDREDFKKLTPLLGTYGFGGYFGYYFSFPEWTFYRLYATERKRLVLIENIYEETYIVSCTDPDALVAQTITARDKKREEIFRHAMENPS